VSDPALVSTNRLAELAQTVQDEYAELGPLDRTDLLSALDELLGIRKAEGT
jgi:hypothetical protein